MNMLEVNNISKIYPNGLGIKDISCKIEQTGVYGILGANGAGKSTLFNIITGYLAPSSGSVLVNGYDIYKQPEKAKACIGYLPEIPPLYPDMTVLEYLEFAAELKKIPTKNRHEEVDEACITTGITDVAGRLIRNLSKGYKQRVGLAQAILGKPDIIILDEPTVGLDPAQIIEIRELIANLGKKHTIILSSHILTEISAVCNYIFIISKGQLVAADTNENLLTQMAGGQEVEVVLKGAQDILVYEGLPGVDHVEELPQTEPDSTHIIIYGNKEQDIRETIFTATVRNDYILLDMNSVKRSLEEVFLEITSSDNKAEEI